MTEKQKRFIEAYISDPNATKAAKSAGYSEKNADKIGAQLLGKTRVREAIAQNRAILAEKAGITAEMVVNGLLREANGEFSRTVLDIEGKAQQVEDTNPSARVAAWEKLGKHLGMFEEKAKDLNLRVYFGGEDRLEDEG